jgi:glutathione S-transferase
VLKLYHAPLTRSVRIYWLLEELGLPYELVKTEFKPPGSGSFVQATPAGKFPTLQDGSVTMFESGAILEYVLERYGKGRLAPEPGTPERAPYLQWLHFAESTAFPPVGYIARHTLFERNAEKIPEVMAGYRSTLDAALDVLERALEGRDYLLGSELSGADVMMGYTLQTAKWLGVLGEGRPNVQAYLARLAARPAFQKAFGA